MPFLLLVFVVSFNASPPDSLNFVTYSFILFMSLFGSSLDNSAREDILSATLFPLHTYFSGTYFYLSCSIYIYIYFFFLLLAEILKNFAFVIYICIFSILFGCSITLPSIVSTLLSLDTCLLSTQSCCFKLYRLFSM